MAWANDVPTYQVSRAITTDEFDALYKEVSPVGFECAASSSRASCCCC